MRIVLGEPDTSQMSERDRFEVEYINRYTRRRLAEEFAKADRAKVANPSFSFTKLLGWQR